MEIPQWNTHCGSCRTLSDQSGDVNKPQRYRQSCCLQISPVSSLIEKSRLTEVKDAKAADEWFVTILYFGAKEKDMLQSLAYNPLCHAQRMARPDTSQLAATRMSNPFQAGILNHTMTLGNKTTESECQALLIAASCRASSVAKA